MKIGLALDQLLCDTAGAKIEWGLHDPTLSFTNDNPFWGSLVPYPDVAEAAEWLRDKEFYIFAERHTSLLPVTRGWLRSRCGINVGKEQLVMQALKRYDCRLRGINLFVDADPLAIENLKIERVSPIEGYVVNREQGQSIMEVLEKIA